MRFIFNFVNKKVRFLEYENTENSLANMHVYALTEYHIQSFIGKM